MYKSISCNLCGGVHYRVLYQWPIKRSRPETDSYLITEPDITPPEQEKIIKKTYQDIKEFGSIDSCEIFDSTDFEYKFLNKKEFVYVRKKDIIYTSALGGRLQQF